MSGPLDGVRILDLTRLLPGNYCTLLLADLGADVIKIEEPGRGDYIRWMPPLVDGEGTIHRALNRGKRSMTLNLKAEGGPEVLRRLARDADALIEGFRPGVLDRLGAGYEVLAEGNRRLVWCAITGYGQDGPYRDRVGHDINYLGYAGVLHAAGPPDDLPVLPPVQVGDLSGGMAGALGTVAALFDAARTGHGRFVDASMMDVAASWGAVIMGWLLGTGEVPARGSMPLTGGLACYRVYRAGDGGMLSVGALETRFWHALCDALDLPDLRDRQYDPDQEAIAARLAEVFASRSRDEWVDRLAHLETCVGPVNDVREALEDPQVRHRGIPAEIDGTVVGPGPALKVSGHDPSPVRAPALGEHTDEVLGEAGLGEEEVAALRAGGVL